MATAIAADAATLAQDWDKVFPKSDKVEHAKVTFCNRFGITLAADCYKPKVATSATLPADNGRDALVASGKLAAIAVAGPFGAVKEQSSGLYAQALAERGFLAIAFDPSFTGESGGEPRYAVASDICTEDFSAAVDYLATRGDVDAERIGILGICGWGGFAINAAALDVRVKATVASTMYDMNRVMAKGYFDSADTPDARNALRRQLAEVRGRDANGALERPARAGGVPETLPDDAPPFVRDYHAYYKTPRGFHPRSLNSTDGFNASSRLSLINTPLLAYADEIESAVMVLHGEKAHSRYFGETAFKKLRGGNKELVIVPGASHTDLYDGGGRDAIPFDHLADFYRRNMK